MNPILIDFDALQGAPDRAMKRVVQLLNRAGAQVLKVESDGRTRRAASIAYREVLISLADSQQVSMRVKQSSDIYEVRLNGKAVPIKAQDDPTKAIQEIVAMLDTGRAKHQKRMAAVAMKPPEGMKTAVPKIKDRLTEQIRAVDEEIVAAKEELAELAGNAA